MKRYKARPGHILRVGLFKVTDDARGVQLRETPCVREHVRLGRLILVEPTATESAETEVRAPILDPVPVPENEVQGETEPATQAPAASTKRQGKRTQRRGKKETAHE